MHNLKVIVFGRGYGESILIELENNEWMIVDCFNHPQTKEPVALSYLINIGLEPKKVLKKIVLTHFHQDHISGMATLIKAAADDATVFMPLALSSKEATKYYAELDVLHGYDHISGIKELADILDYMTKANRTIKKLKVDTNLHNGEDYQVFALSPSDYDCAQSQEIFISEITSVDANKKGDKLLPLSASKNSHNHYCVVLNIFSKKNKTSVLLGSDLEVGNSEQEGWTAAMIANMAPEKGSIEMVKVPHHGSENGYHKLTWDEYVIDDAVAVITEFTKSGLPREEYIKVYKEHTSNLFATTQSKNKIANTLSPSALKILKSKNQLGTITNVIQPNSFGYVEVIHSEQSPSIELFHDAYRM